MDNIGRLTIVDGDTDTAPVQEDFRNVVKEHVEYIKRQQQDQGAPAANGYANGHVPNGHLPGETTLQDLESESIETISKHVGNGVAHSVANGVRTMANGFTNGHIPNGYTRDLPQYTSFDTRQDNRQMYNEVNYMDGHI